MKRLPLIALIFLLFFSVENTVHAQTQSDNFIGSTHFELRQKGLFVAKMSVWWDSKTQGHYYYQTHPMKADDVSGFSVPDDATNIGVSAYVFGLNNPPSLYFPNGLKGVSAVCADGGLISGTFLKVC